MNRLHSFVVLVACTLILGGCGRYSRSGYTYLSLSPDGNTVVSDWCGYKESPCTIASYSFETNKVHLYRNTSHRDWNTPRFSSDGRHLAFSIAVPESDDRQIAVIDADGSGFREVTKGRGYRSTPAFSNDGNKLTYQCAEGLTERYWTPYKGNVRRLKNRNICVFDLLTKRERKIISFYVYSYSNPLFMPDGKHVLFYFQGKKFGKSIAQNIENLQSKSILNEMPLAHSPRISRDGKRIVFSARTNEMDGANGNFNYDLFLWEGSSDILKSKGKIRRLTKAESYLTGFALSADGRKVAYAFDKERNGDTEFFLMDIDSGKIRKFSIPDRPAGLIGPKS